MRKILLAVSLFYSQFAFSQQADTIYFTRDWKICEKPRAAYYRECHLSTDSALFYYGNVKDFYINGRLQMDGNYSANGAKNGLFTSYYSNGNPMFKGSFAYNHMHSYWYYFYSNGDSAATFYFSGQPNEFTCMSFYDSTGNKTVSDGTGEFYWTMYNSVARQYFLLSGAFLQSKRDGVWNYYNMNFRDTGKYFLQYEENYRNGEFISGKQNALLNKSNTYKEEKNIIDFTSDKFSVTESFAHDPIFNVRNEFDDNIDFNNFLKYGPPFYYLLNASSENEYVKFLTGHLYRFLDYSKFYKPVDTGYSWSINLQIDANGSPDNFSFTGDLPYAVRLDCEYIISKFWWDVPGKLREQIKNKTLLIRMVLEKEEVLKSKEKFWKSILDDLPDLKEE